MNRELFIGWGQGDITPEKPVYITGQFHIRVSEEIKDPITVTACAMESDSDHVVFLSCDLVSIPNELRDQVRSLLPELAADLDPMKVIIHATHTHSAPEIRVPVDRPGMRSRSSGNTCVELQVQPIEEYVAYAAAVMATCVAQAWHSRKSGKIAHGLGYTVVGRNRRWVNDAGSSQMYGLRAGEDRFRHIEGFEDHSLQLLATYDGNNKLTGLFVNLACPSQVSENEFFISADYWHETRKLLRSKFGEDLFILPQCSAAGDQSPHLLYEIESNQRMLQIKNRTVREEIAHRIATAVEDLLPHLSSQAVADPVMRHHVETVDVPLNSLDESDAQQAKDKVDHWRSVYEQEKHKLDADPELQNTPRWYTPITRAYRIMLWNEDVIGRFELQTTNAVRPSEVHVLRLGEIVFATNPFEYYLDFGVQVKLRSPAVQTFLVQLAGEGTYVPSPRSVQGGGYGSVPASNPIGPDGGQLLADHKVRVIRSMWE